MLESNVLWNLGWQGQVGLGDEGVDGEDQFRRLEERAARSGMKLAVDHIDGHWRAGFLVTNEVGESVLVLHATGPDEGSAIRTLARLVG